MAHSKLLIFKLGNGKYACDTIYVDRIVKYENLTYLPSEQSTLEGLYNYEGDVIKIYNLSKRLGIKSEDDKTHKKIIIVKNKSVLVGIIVDEVLEVFNYYGEDQENSGVEDICKLEKLDFKYVKDMILIDDEIVIYLSIIKIVKDELKES